MLTNMHICSCFHLHIRSLQTCLCCHLTFTPFCCTPTLSSRLLPPHCYPFPPSLPFPTPGCVPPSCLGAHHKSVHCSIQRKAIAKEETTEALNNAERKIWIWCIILTAIFIFGWPLLALPAGVFPKVLYLTLQNLTVPVTVTS